MAREKKKKKQMANAITWLLLADIICLGRRRWIRFRAVW